MYKIRKQGFTLIELLVVIAIIGILSAVVLASLNTARDKGSDAAVKSDLDGIRTQASIYYDNNGDYGTTASATTGTAGCTSANTMFSNDNTIKAQVSAADGANGSTNNVYCNTAASGTAYAISAELVSQTGSNYCVDSTGFATTTATALGTNTVCPS